MIRRPSPGDSVQFKVRSAQADTHRGRLTRVSVLKDSLGLPRPLGTVNDPSLHSFDSSATQKSSVVGDYGDLPRLPKERVSNTALAATRESFVASFGITRTQAQGIRRSSQSSTPQFKYGLGQKPSCFHRSWGDAPGDGVTRPAAKQSRVRNFKANASGFHRLADRITVA